MLRRLPFVFFLLVQIEIGAAFFKNSPLQLNNITLRLNLTCVSDFGESDPFTNCEYCVYEFFNNGTDSTMYRDCIYLTNTYRLVTQRCSGFTRDSDVGYGACSPLPFEYFDIDLLCICATDHCNENFTTCKRSVDSNPKPTVMPTPIPTLTTASSSITCHLRYASRHPQFDVLLRPRFYSVHQFDSMWRIRSKSHGGVYVSGEW